MEFDVKVFNEDMLKERFSSYVLGVDIGGTNTNLGIAGIKNSKPILLFSLNYNSQELDSLVPAIENTLSYAKENYDITVDFACIGAPGVISTSNDYAELTNLEWHVSSEEIIEHTYLHSVSIINDFVAVGYGINLLDLNNRKDIVQIRNAKNNVDLLDTKAIIGAGTGLGKSILIYDKKNNAYIPIPSEGGHADLPLQINLELQMAKFIKKLRGIQRPITYEEVLSGRGIEAIYLFLRQLDEFQETKYTKEIDEADDKTPLISKYRYLDETCKETFYFFTIFYARCAKNFVLDSLARGGLYIAGGIAEKNRDIFESKDFIEEFELVYRKNEIIKDIPIYLIINYDVSLYGACFAAMLQSQK